MKKVKAYINIIDELDLISEILKLINLFQINNETDTLKIPKNLLEYEDGDHVFHYSDECVINSFNALNFNRINDYENVYAINENTLITYKNFNDENLTVIQLLKLNNPQIEKE